MNWSGHSTSAIIVLLVACGHHDQGALGVDATSASFDATGDHSIDAHDGTGADATRGDASAIGTADAATSVGVADAGTDADCWSCGLPDGTVGTTTMLSEADCVIHFFDGVSDPIADEIFVVLRGTSPGALTVDVQIDIADKLVCSSPVAADGTWSCSETSNYNAAMATGRIDGTTFTASWRWEEDDYTLTCPTMTGTLQL